MSEAQEYRNMPQSELDLQMSLTNSVWGTTEVSKELRERLNRFYSAGIDEEGNTLVTKSSLWGLLGYYTRDIRLGNLSEWNNELQTCRYMLDLAGDLLQADLIEPFLICLSRAVTILETSQSKRGFLRNIMNTFIQETRNQNLEPPKKGFMGMGGKDKNQGGY
jgi:hypothetical protein